MHAGKTFLQKKETLGRDTSYTDMSVALARRTHRPPFDFSTGRAVRQVLSPAGPSRKPTGAWGYLFADRDLLEANGARLGFYHPAQAAGALPNGATRLTKEEFRISRMEAVYRFFDDGGRLDT